MTYRMDTKIWFIQILTIFPMFAHLIFKIHETYSHEIDIRRQENNLFVLSFILLYCPAIEYFWDFRKKNLISLYIKIKSCSKHRFPWLTLTIHPYHPGFLESPPDSIQCLHKSDEFVCIQMVSSIATYCLHTVKWFWVLLFIVCTQLNGFEYCYLLFALS